MKQPDEFNIGDQWDLVAHRLQIAEEDLETANLLMDCGKYRGANNRAYYSIYHTIDAVLSVHGIAFKRHKDTLAYFNKNYVATGIFDREIGRNLARLKQKREQSDYDDFFIASKEEAQKQFDNAESIVAAIIEYMRKNNSGTII